MLTRVAASSNSSVGHSLRCTNKDLETYSEQSPLGAAILGAQEGETREYYAPNGNTISVTVVSAEPYDSIKAATLRDS